MPSRASRVTHMLAAERSRSDVGKNTKRYWKNQTESWETVPSGEALIHPRCRKSLEVPHLESAQPLARLKQRGPAAVSA